MLRESSRIAWIPAPRLFWRPAWAFRHTMSDRGCLLDSPAPEGSGTGPVNGLPECERTAGTNRQPPVPGVQVVQCGIQRGLLLGIACRIDPCFQAICNFDSGKVSVNRNGVTGAGNCQKDTFCALSSDFLPCMPAGSQILEQIGENLCRQWHDSL